MKLSTGFRCGAWRWIWESAGRSSFRVLGSRFPRSRGPEDSMYRCIDVSMYRCIEESKNRRIDASVHRFIGASVNRCFGASVLGTRFLDSSVPRSPSIPSPPPSNPPPPPEGGVSPPHSNTPLLLPSLPPPTRGRVRLADAQNSLPLLAAPLILTGSSGKLDDRDCLIREPQTARALTPRAQTQYGSGCPSNRSRNRIDSLPASAKRKAEEWTP